MRTILKLLIACLLVSIVNIFAQESSQSFFKNADEFFKINVVHGRVNYSLIKDNPEKLNRLVEDISKLDVFFSFSIMAAPPSPAPHNCAPSTPSISRASSTI